MITKFTFDGKSIFKSVKKDPTELNFITAKAAQLNIYTGTPGAKGDKGDQGDTGPVGPPGAGSVTSVFSRIGVVIAASGDYNTSQVNELTNLYFTDARVRATLLTGFAVLSGNVTAADSVLTAIEKLWNNLLFGADQIPFMDPTLGRLTTTSRFSFDNVNKRLSLSINPPLADFHIENNNAIVSQIVKALASTAQSYFEARNNNLDKLQSGITSTAFVTAGLLVAKTAFIQAITANVLLIQHTGNAPVRIATNGTVRIDVDGSGLVTISNLAGVGSRMVVVDANGLLSTQAIVSVLTTVLTGLNITGGSISATDNVLQAFGKLQNQISGILGGATYQGVWNATTNSPALSTGVGTKGFYYVVNVAGSTNLDGITDWKIGDWAIYNGTAWNKVDNTDAVSSVNGFAGAVNLTTADITEVTNLYFTAARAIASLLTGFVSGAGVVSATDSILQAIQKLNGNIAAKQDTLVSATNIKTINGNSILGGGDLVVGLTPLQVMGMVALKF